MHDVEARLDVHLLSSADFCAGKDVLILKHATYVHAVLPRAHPRGRREGASFFERFFGIDIRFSPVRALEMVHLIF